MLFSISRLPYYLRYHRHVLIFKSRWGTRQMRLLSTFVALALSTSVAVAGDLGPLSPGAPAGVKHAQEGDNTILYSVLGAGAVAVIAFVVSNGGSTIVPKPVSQSSSTTTGTAA